MSNRERLERIARRRLGSLSRDHLAELERLLGNPPDPSNVPQSFWSRVEAEHKRTLSGVLLLAFMAGADEWSDGDVDGSEWSDDQAEWTAKRYTDTSRERLERLADEWHDDAPLSGELRHGLSGIFGADRDATVYGTEITRGMGAGVVQAAKASPEYQDGRLSIVWRLGPREKHCPICLRLADTDESVWGLEVDSPPIHPVCGCYLEIVRV
jgi:hypothetical protein